MLLKDLEILVVDCQLSGPSPYRDNLIEIGWGYSSASKIGENLVSNLETYIIPLPEGAKLPIRISRLTGLKTEDLYVGESEDNIWEYIHKASTRILKKNKSNKCLTVIHYYSIEKYFLRKLHEDYGGDSSFPFDIICSHAIAKRLFPGMPRRGLRALVGYFGHSVDKHRRCENHIPATAVIWKNIVEILGKDHGVTDLDKLRQWIATTKPSRGGREYAIEKDTRLSLPDNPGIYKMLRENGDILYIGKAKSLKTRVNTYFRKGTKHVEKNLEMLTQTKSFDIIQTNTALEAAMLETDEIKKNRPPYNIALMTEHRNIWFCLPDFSYITNKIESDKLIGPFNERIPLELISNLHQMLEYNIGTGLGHEEISALLGIPVKYSPDPSCFYKGLDIFKDKFDDHLQGNYTIRDLIKFGKKLKLDLLQFYAGFETEEEEDTVMNDDAKRDSVWTPDDVSELIEKILMRAITALKRAGWFCLLSESSIIWDKTNRNHPGMNLMILNDGKISVNKTVSSSLSIPVPPGFTKPVIERRKNFDLTLYDRMRVLTTEIKRIISEGREIKIRLSRSITLDNKKITSLLELTK